VSAGQESVPSALLSDDELAHLVDSPLPAKQIKWLDEHGWIYVLSRRGRPRVARAYLEQRLGVLGRPEKRPARLTEPDWGALRKAPGGRPPRE
jgi:hypothetical protein